MEALRQRTATREGLTLQVFDGPGGTSILVQEQQLENSDLIDEHWTDVFSPEEIRRRNVAMHRAREGLAVTLLVVAGDKAAGKTTFFAALTGGNLHILQVCDCGVLASPRGYRGLQGWYVLNVAKCARNAHTVQQDTTRRAGDPSFWPRVCGGMCCERGVIICSFSRRGTSGVRCQNRRYPTAVGTSPTAPAQPTLAGRYFGA